MKPRDPDASLGALELIEEAVHTLRLAPVGTWLCHFVGTAPFVLGLLFFWSDMSRNGQAEKHLVPGALGLAGLFLWMKCWQSIFAQRLAAQISGEALPAGFGLCCRVAVSQGVVHALGIVVLPFAAFLMLPLGWVYALLQNVTVFGLREPGLGSVLRRGLRQTRLAPLQNHAALSILALFSLFVLLDLGLTLLAAPYLLKLFLGVDTAFTLSLASALNTTFLATAAGLTYLCVDPVLKAVYTLRCFHGEARQSGADLRVLLRQSRSAIPMLLLGLVLLLTGRIHAAAPAPPAPAPADTRAEELNASIERVLNRAEYTWRSPRVKEETSERKESTLIINLREWLRTAARTVGEWIEAIFRRLGGGGGGGGQFKLNPEGFTYILTAVMALLIGILVWYLWRTRSRSVALEIAATSAAPVPDLTREDVSGAELPVDGWTKLALELLERGELRLAMRAFYLASLAHLATRNLVSIARGKSNRDYERELQRRSHALPELARTFAANGFVFDRVWYGRHELDAEGIREFRQNLERIQSC